MAVVQTYDGLVKTVDGVVKTGCCCDCLEYALSIDVTSDGCCCFDFSVEMTPPATTTIVSYEWDFGDGSTSTSATPSHCYEETGTYEVTLTTVDAEGCTKITTAEVSCTCPEGEEPVANFTYTQTDGDPCCFSFTNTSTTNCERTATYLWNFGDGGTSTAANPTHCYAGEGPWDVTLTVTDSAGCTDAVIGEVVCGPPILDCCNCFAGTLPTSVTVTLRNYRTFPGVDDCGDDLNRSFDLPLKEGETCLWEDEFELTYLGTVRVTASLGAGNTRVIVRPLDLGIVNADVFEAGCPAPGDCSTRSVLNIPLDAAGHGGWGCGMGSGWTPEPEADVTW